MIEALEIYNHDPKEIRPSFKGLDVNNIRMFDTYLEDGMGFTFPETIQVLSTIICGRTCYYCPVKVWKKTGDTWMPIFDTDDEGNTRHSVRRFFPGTLGRTLRFVIVDSNNPDRILGTGNKVVRASGPVVEDYKHSKDVDDFIEYARKRCDDNQELIVVHYPEELRGWIRNINYNPNIPDSRKTCIRGVGVYTYEKIN